jgi:hypothetical protein
MCWIFPIFSHPDIITKPNLYSTINEEFFTHPIKGLTDVVQNPCGKIPLKLVGRTLFCHCKDLILDAEKTKELLNKKQESTLEPGA